MSNIDLSISTYSLNKPLNEEAFCLKNSSKELSTDSLTYSVAIQKLGNYQDNSETSQDKSQKSIQRQNPSININSHTQLIYNLKTEKFVLITKAPAKKNLVVNGGGAKAALLPGTMRALEECQEDGLSLREILENIAGSSAGALFGALVAVGMPGDELEEVIGKEDLSKLLGQSKAGFFSYLFPYFFKDGNPLLHFLKKNIQKSISSHLMQMMNTDQLNSIKAEELTKVQLAKRGIDYDSTVHVELVKSLEEILCNLKREPVDEMCITFAMLKSLHELDPKIFKNLTVTGTCCENGQVFYFDAEKTPNLDIAIACRASASLPIFLNPITIDSKLLAPGYSVNSPYLTFVDGGYFDNIPISPMEDKQRRTAWNRGEGGQNLHTLVLVFDDKVYKPDQQSLFFEVKVPPHALYDSSKWEDRFVRDIMASYIANINTKERHTLASEQKLEEVRLKYSQRVIPLRIDIGTVDFQVATRSYKKYSDDGYAQTMAYFTERQKEAIYKIFDNFGDVWECLTHSDKANLNWSHFIDFTSVLEEAQKEEASNS